MAALASDPVDRLQVPALAGAACVVVKIGSALLVDGATGVLRADWLRSLAADVAWLRGQGTRVVIVSSGSIALGRGVLGLAPGQGRLDEIQAAASVGQIRLARSYEDALSAHGLTSAQILLTLEDSAQRRRYLNTRATLRTLLEMGVVPVVNENDTVATDEIRYGDNDRLGAQVASLAGADRLVLLSDVDGLYTGDPRVDPGARHLPLVADLTPQVEAMAGGTGTLGAKGGMKTKLLAARVAMQAGADMAITRGERENPLRALADGARATWFLAGRDPRAARKQWISAMKPKGRISVDRGAARALAGGKSLLAAGVVAVDGDFERGDPVEICGPDGALLTLGMTGYDAGDARAIRGLKTADIAAVLGYPARAALVHRDDMAI